MNHKRKIIGVSGGAGAGKDTFFNIIKTIVPCKRFALADALKADLRDELIRDYGIDILNCTLEQKNKVRPYLVSYGKLKRDESQGMYWTSKLQKLIEADDGDELIVVTDIRYVIYPKDEYYWLKSIMEGQLVFIQNYWQNFTSRTFPEPVNDDERHNNAILKNLSDYYIEWPIILRSQIEQKDFLNKALEPYVRDFIEQYEGRRPNKNGQGGW